MNFIVTNHVQWDEYITLGLNFFYRICWNQDLKFMILREIKSILYGQSTENEWTTRVIDSHSVCTVSFVKRRSRSTEIQHDTSLRVPPTCLSPWQKIFKACSVNGWKCFIDVARNSQKKHLREVYFLFRRSAMYNVMTQMTVLFCLFVFVTHIVESEGYPNRILLSIISQTLRVGVSVHF